MYPSILQFCENGIIKLDDFCAKFFEDPTDIAGFVIGVKDELLRTACGFLSDAFEEMDEQIRNSALRSKDWTIVRRDRKPMLTSIGEISYNKTLYIHKKSGERAYLLDRILGLEENARMTEDAKPGHTDERKAPGCWRKPSGSCEATWRGKWPIALRGSRRPQAGRTRLTAVCTGLT